MENLKKTYIKVIFLYLQRIGGTPKTAYIV